MTEWRECKLGDVIVLNYGKALPEKKRVFGNIPVYSSAGLTGYHNESLVNGRGIIIGRKGTIGSVHFSYKPFWCIDTAYYITDNEEYNLKYIYYLLQTLGLNELNEDSAVPGLNRNTAYQQDISFPPLPEQKAIAEVLSSLDDKIDLLTRQNKTLEDLAQTYFRKWFVEDASEDWEDISFGQLFTISSGKGLKREQFIEYGVYPVLGANGEIGRTNEYLFNERLIYTGRVGTLGEVFIVDQDPVWLSDNTLVFRNIEHFYFVYFTLKTLNLADYNVGSTQPLIRQSDIKEIRISLPNKEILDCFDNYANAIFEKIKANHKQIYLINKLRDTLLPKLISGEVRVKQ